MVHRIMIEDGLPPYFEGQWSVGEILQVAQGLELWVRSLAVNLPAEPKEQKEQKDEMSGVSSAERVVS